MGSDSVVGVVGWCAWGTPIGLDSVLLYLVAGLAWQFKFLGIVVDLVA